VIKIKNSTILKQETLKSTTPKKLDFQVLS